MKSIRKEAAKKGEKFFFTGRACKHNHLSARYTATGNCVQCLKERHERLQSESDEYRQQRLKTASEYQEAHKHEDAFKLKRHLRYLRDRFAKQEAAVKDEIRKLET